MSGIPHPCLVIALAVPAAFALACGDARAQAWTPDRGDGTVSVTYQNYDVAGHFDVHGRKNNNGSTLSHAVLTELDYGVTDTFGLIVSLPFIASKYTGQPDYVVGGHLTHRGPLDDGTYHGAFQDVRAELRRLLPAGPLVITPFAGISVPTHSYQTVGEAVPGRHRRDVQVGTYVGVGLDRFAPGSYVQGRYALASAEKVNGFPFVRSNVDLEGGYAATNRLVVRGIVNWQIRHKGPTLDELAPDWVNHDRFIAPAYLNLGTGAAFSITGSADIYALWAATVSGNNGAHRARTLAAGVTFSLRPRWHGLGYSTAAAAAGVRGRVRLRRPFAWRQETAEPGT